MAYMKDSTGKRLDAYPVIAGIANPDDVGYDIIALLGQSNTFGAGEGIDTTMLDTTDGRVKQWPGSGAYVGQIVTATDPLTHVQTASGVGPGMTAGRSYARIVPPNRPVLLVPCALGSTAFTEVNLSGTTYSWDPANTTAQVNLYARAVASIAAALASHANNRLKVVYWGQGEGDTTAMNQAQYAAALDRLIDGLRAQFGADFDVLVAQMVPERLTQNAGYPLVNAAHIDTPRRKVRTAFIDGPTASYNSPAGGGTIHYNAAGARELGRRAIEDALPRARANVLGAPPLAPPAPLLVQTGTSVAASWVRPRARVTDYNVRYRVDGGSWNTLTRAQSIDNTATIADLTLGQTLDVQVRSVNEQGTSDWSAAATITLVTLPAQVSGVAAGTTTAAAVPLTWNPAARATSYRVEYKLSSASTWTTAGTATGTSYTVVGLSETTSYDFRVTALNAAGAGTTSTALTASTATVPTYFEAVGTTPLFGYSLRKLGAGSTAVRVRRSSDNTESDIGFAGRGLDTAALLAFVGPGDGYVTKFYNQGSASSADLAQTDTTKQAKIVSAGSVLTSGGKPAVQFTGVEVYKHTAPGLYAAGAATMQGVWTALTSGVAASQAVFVESGASGSTALYAAGYWQSAGAPAFIINSTSGGSVGSLVGAAVGKDGAIRQVSSTDSGTALNLWVNGTANAGPTSYTRGSSTIGQLVLGGILTGAAVAPSIAFVGMFSEAVGFGSVLGTSARQAGESNQKTIYSIA
jgi:hypothetical protein